MLLSCQVLAQNYIRVEGTGSTIELAKENAFREAIQLAVGTIVLSNRTIDLKEIKIDNISTYSAGYIDDFKILNLTKHNNQFIIVLDVLVADSRLYDQVLSVGRTDSEVHGNKIHSTVQTYINQRNQADKMFAQLMHTFPDKAFIVSSRNFTVYMDNYRNTTISVPYQLIWNYDFLASLNEALANFKDNNFNYFQHAPGNITIMAKNPKDFIIGERMHHKFKDTVFLENLEKLFTGNNEVRIKMNLRDANNNIIYSQCHTPVSLTGRKDPFYSLYDHRRMVIYGNEKENSNLEITMSPRDINLIKHISNIELAVVARKKCNN